MKTSKVKFFTIFLTIVLTFFTGCQPENVKNNSKSQDSQGL